MAERNHRRTKSHVKEMNVRFQDMTRATVANYAQFIHANDGVNPPGMTQEEWALQRFFISESILQHPNDQDMDRGINNVVMFSKVLRFGMTMLREL